jgi:3-deoxy-D-manno-octulosonic-acid transferase
VWQRCAGNGVSATFGAANSNPAHLDTAVFLGDSMGELLLFYAATDLAFVGGSLVATGGHNVLEPALLGFASAVRAAHVQLHRGGRAPDSKQTPLGKSLMRRNWR